MSMEYIGLAKGNGKAVFLISARKIEELAGQLQLPCPRFVLLLMQDATNRNEQLPETLGQLLDAGCVAFCAWGPECEQVHDIMDDVIIARDLDRQAATILTTWHDDEPFDETLDYAVMWPALDDNYADGCDAVIVANIGGVTDPDELHRMLHERVSASTGN